MLVFYDSVIFALSMLLFLFLYVGKENLWDQIILYGSLCYFVTVFLSRFAYKIYGQIWRYGGIQCYIKFLAADCTAFLFFSLVYVLLPFEKPSLVNIFFLACVNLLGALVMRMAYRYVYKCSGNETVKGRFFKLLLRIFAGYDVKKGAETQKIKVAIIGAGTVGVGLAKELLSNEASAYRPCCFIDISKKKIGREIQGIPVLAENKATFEKLKAHGIQEIIFAIPSKDANKKKELYDFYKNSGYKLKVYDYPTVRTANGKRQLRDFDIEELLFRKSVQMVDAKTAAYYKNKVIMITGGGGSIGSELCRQISKMQPKQLIILDVYENGAYDIQQELKISYRDQLDIQVEIASITDRKAMEKVFSIYRPQIVIHAAAHKHVPFMEHNCVEAIENNVFGTKQILDLCEAFEVDRFMMVSTDKAVNPTNVMGATKRMCEMMVQSQSIDGKTKYSATRFGNVLGSAGSVIPLFKKQIASGGPITLTDKRIIRYFMTIPEASQLVLQSGAMANNGELFVLDMGEPVKILDLAQNMIQLSGAGHIEIIETGLRPGEKLYEELLVNTEELDKTENQMIFIEKDKPLSKECIQEKLKILEKACASENNDVAREALRQVVPTFKRPEEVNVGY